MKISTCILLTTTLLLVSCVNEDDLQTLHNRLDDQNRQMQMLESRLDQTNSQFTELSDVRPTQANLWAEIEGLRSRTAVMEGRIDSLEHSISGQATSQEELNELSQQVADLDKKLQYAANQLALDLNPPAANATLPATIFTAQGEAPADEAALQQPTAPPAISDNPAQALYDQALAQFQERNYDVAQSIWAEFVKTFPDNPLVPNAHFWQGESYYQMEDYARAILSYQEVITKYTDSIKYKTALLKQGISFYKLGRKTAGRLILQNVIQNFPESAEAKRAQEFLRTNS